MTQEKYGDIQENDDNTIGYCKPPKKYQFKPGQSGNPNGRPKGSKSFNQILKKELAEKVTIRDGKKVKKINKKELLAKRLVKDAADGKSSAMRDLMVLIAADEANDAATGKSANLSTTARTLIDGIMAKAGLEDPK